MTQTDSTNDGGAFTKDGVVRAVAQEHYVQVKQMRELLRYCSRRPFRRPCLVLSAEGARFVALQRIS